MKSTPLKTDKAGRQTASPTTTWPRSFFITSASINGAVGLLLLYHSYRLGLDYYLGVIAHIIPSYLSAYLTFTYIGAQHTYRILRRFFIAEIVKLAMYALLSLIALSFFVINIWAYFFGMILSISAYIWAPFIIKWFEKKR